MTSLGDQNTGGFSNSNGSPLNSAMIQKVLLASRGVGNWIKLQGTYKKTELKLNKYQKKYKSIRMQEISYFDQNFVREIDIYYLFSLPFDNTQRSGRVN